MTETGSRTIPPTYQADDLAGDLEWVIFSPSLLSQKIIPDLPALPQSRQIIDRIKADPTPLLTFLKTMKRQNMGTYFEYLVFFWLDQLNNVTVLESNLQIRDASSTFGELDILFEYQSVLYHWELAVKFYANTGDGRSEANWVGPMKRDNLKKKLDRLFEHQLSLATIPEAQALLKPKGIDDVTPHPFVKGMLFDKIGNPQIPTDLPPRISPTCNLHHWCPISELTIEHLNEATHYCFLFKPRWISQPHFHDWLKINTIETLRIELQKLFEFSPRPVLLALGQQSSDKIDDGARLFIMPDQWDLDFTTY